MNREVVDNGNHFVDNGFCNYYFGMTAVILFG